MYFWKCFRIFVLSQTTSSSKWTTFIVTEWENVNAGAPQDSILGLLLIFIYINDLSNEVSSNYKPFANNSSLFSVVNNIQSNVVQISCLLAIYKTFIRGQLNYANVMYD